MGLLYLGSPLVWDEAKQYADHVRTYGIAQFLYIWDHLKDKQGNELLWGDEVCLDSISSFLYIYIINWICDIIISLKNCLLFLYFNMFY
jgi:hypothetical protein